MEVSLSIKKHKWWKASRKSEIAIALLNGEPFYEVRQVKDQSAHVLNRQKETFLQGGQNTFQVSVCVSQRECAIDERKVACDGLRFALQEDQSALSRWQKYVVHES